MGPLAAIGDTLFQGSLGTIIAAVCMGFAQEGSIVGAILQVVIWGVIMFAGKWGLLVVTYKKGESFITELLATNAFDRLTEVISIAGLMMMGVLTSTTVTFSLNWVITSGGTEVNIQTDLLDKLLPGMLPLIIVFTVFKLLKKRVPPTRIIYGMMVIGIALAYLGMV
jgi:PTS system mannose-specific IID component